MPLKNISRAGKWVFQLSPSDVGDRRILAGSPSAALLSKPGDETSMADQLTHALSDDLLLQSIRENTRHRASDFYWSLLVK